MTHEITTTDAQTPPAGPFRSPIHYCPSVGTVADIIPFFWKGEYHVFYLHHGLGTGTPWDHIVSRDLIHWEELPRALPLGAAHEPDGGNVYTGSVLEHEGTFHIFYTGFNPEHPDGREHIMHATSPDLIAWTKQPGHTFKADGVHYRDIGGEDFRDPFVFWNEEEKAWWMLLCARDGRNGQPVTGLCTSGDLVHWRQRRPLTGNWSCPPECPDLFQTGGMWYLIASAQNWTTVHRFADDLRSLRAGHADPLRRQDALRRPPAHPAGLDPRAQGRTRRRHHRPELGGRALPAARGARRPRRPVTHPANRRGGPAFHKKSL